MNNNSKKEITKNRSFNSRYEIALKNEIDKYLESQAQNYDPSQLHFLSPKLEKERASVELYEAINSSEFAKKIDSALEMISHEGTRYISAQDLDLLMDNFSEANNLFERIDFDQPTTATYKEILKLND